MTEAKRALELAMATSRALAAPSSAHPRFFRANPHPTPRSLERPRAVRLRTPRTYSSRRRPCLSARQPAQEQRAPCLMHGANGSLPPARADAGVPVASPQPFFWARSPRWNLGRYRDETEKPREEFARSPHAHERGRRRESPRAQFGAAGCARCDPSAFRSRTHGRGIVGWSKKPITSEPQNPCDRVYRDRALPPRSCARVNANNARSPFAPPTPRSRARVAERSARSSADPD